MPRVVHYTPDLLEFARNQSVEDRVRQALCAWRVFHELHKPYAKPFRRGFDTVEEFWRWEEEQERHGRTLEA